ncbi:MAG: DUF6530 family protein [Clostridia bacterium]
MKIPTLLKHKPVIVSEDYDKIDGRIVSSDAKGLSIGLAQWNDRGKVDISAKIWRYTGDKWSRQSEEMPIHRVLDLAIFVCRTKLFFREAYKHKSFKEEKEQIDRIALQGGAMNVGLCKENEFLDEDIETINSVLLKDDEIISERLARLSEILKELGY